MGFDRALKKVLKAEGGYSNHPADNGGETFMGITRNFYPKAAIWPLVDATDDKDSLQYNEEALRLVSNFYYDFYWYKLKCDLISDDFIAEMLFNFGINLGKKQVVKKIQRILKVTADGIIGQNTLMALNSADPQAFVNHFLLEIVEFYMQISKKGNNHLFLKGWLNRAMSIYYDSERYFK